MILCQFKGGTPRSGTGYILVVMAATFWAASGTAAKFLFESGLSPYQLVQLRTSIGAAVLTSFILLRKRHGLVFSRGDVRQFLLLGVILAAAQFTYLSAISKIPVAAAILLQYQAPVLIALYSVLAGYQRLTAPLFCVLCGAVTGCFLMVGAYRLDVSVMNVEGIVTGLLSALSFALYSLMSERHMKSRDPWLVLCLALVVAAFIWNLLHPPFEAFFHGLDSSLWLPILYVGIFGTVIPFGLYNEGIARIGATRASITATLEPVMAGVLSFVVIGEVLEPVQIGGAGLVIVSIVFLQRSRREERR
ncbi:MAG TPA: EamA family transporter [Dissulfurispiraceae bacterium]|nr:EamA family transporter [Dissulfurispiraceae bacterium]